MGPRPALDSLRPRKTLQAALGLATSTAPARGEDAENLALEARWMSVFPTHAQRRGEKTRGGPEIKCRDEGEKMTRR